MDVITIVLLVGLFGRVAYGLYNRRVDEVEKTPNRVATKGNVVSISDPLVEKLKSNLELFLASEDALSRSDTEGYLRLKSEAVNNAKKIMGTKREVVVKNRACQK